MFVSLPVDERCKELESSFLGEELFQKTSMGDTEAFRTIYIHTANSVYGFLLSILKNKEDAEDLMQETYIKVREKAHLYQEQGKPLAWILTIAKNLAYMRLREKKKVVFIDIQETEVSLDFSDVANAEDRMVLEAAFRVLNWEERQIVVLHAISGLRHREIGQLLKKPLSTILSKYNRALKKLKREIEEREEEYAGERN